MQFYLIDWNRLMRGIFVSLLRSVSLVMFVRNNHSRHPLDTYFPLNQLKYHIGYLITPNSTSVWGILSFWIYCWGISRVLKAHAQDNRASEVGSTQAWARLPIDLTIGHPLFVPVLGFMAMQGPFMVLHREGCVVMFILVGKKRSLGLER